MWPVKKDREAILEKKNSSQKTLLFAEREMQ
jgi:hypothetical protein